MRTPSGCRTVLLFTPPLLLLLPVVIVTVALERIASGLVAAHTQTELYASLYDSTASSNDTLTVSIWHVPSFVILALCAFACLVAALAACGIWELRRVQSRARRERVWFWVVILFAIAMVGASLGVLGWLSSVEGRGGWASLKDVEDHSKYFSRETWVCGIVPKFYAGEEGWARSACGLSKAARFMTIPLAISAALILVSVRFLIRDRGDFSWLFGGPGRYAGFDGVYEMEYRRQEVIKTQNDRTAFQ